MMPGATSAWSLIDLPKLPEGTSSLASLDWSFTDLYPLPEGCKERLQNALACTVGGLVNGLEASNVEQYLKLLQNVYNIPAEDFDTLEEKVRDAVKSGPRLHVACKRARLAGCKLGLSEKYLSWTNYIRLGQFEGLSRICQKGSTLKDV